jgi:spermidine synthase
MKIEYRQTYDTKREAEEHCRRFLENFPPQGYSSRAEVVPQEGGKWVAETSRYDSCD